MSPKPEQVWETHLEEDKIPQTPHTQLGPPVAMLQCHLAQLETALAPQWALEGRRIGHVWSTNNLSSAPLLPSLTGTVLQRRYIPLLDPFSGV